jgi:3-phenylpropionate/trans-cinnamate dioxygenase ferredoxin subunit
MSGPASGGWVRARGLAQIESGRPAHVDVAGYPVCLAHALGTVCTFRDECTHGSALLSEGELADGAVECWLHSSRPDLATGWVLSPPAARPVAALTVRVAGSDVYIHLPPYEKAS